ncbi:hypothetical protein SCA31_23910, partial [Chryseobacterium sp. SIMBA_028]
HGGHGVVGIGQNAQQRRLVQHGSGKTLGSFQDGGQRYQRPGAVAEHDTWHGPELFQEGNNVAGMLVH